MTQPLRGYMSQTSSKEVRYRPNIAKRSLDLNINVLERGGEEDENEKVASGHSSLRYIVDFVTLQSN